MFKSKKKKEKEAAAAAKDAENSQTEPAPSKEDKELKSGKNSKGDKGSKGSEKKDLIVFNLNKKRSDRKASTDLPDGPVGTPVEDESRTRSVSDAAPTRPSKTRKSILKNSAQLLTSPSEDVEAETLSSASSAQLGGCGDRQTRRKRVSVARDVPKIPLVSQKSFDNLVLPRVSGSKPPEPRDITLKKNFTGDYGFTIRSSTLLQRVPLTGEINERTVHFAETSVSSTQMTGLMPGDKLIKVNDTEIESLSKEQILKLVKESGPQIKITVQPVPELLELCQRCGLDDSSPAAALGARGHSGLTRSKSGDKLPAKTEDRLAAELQFAAANARWLVHKEGYSACTEDGPADDDSGQVKVTLIDSKSQLVVDDSDLEKRNPPELDKVEDLAQLRYLNESSVIHVLRSRYADELTHTFSGYNLLVLNPSHQTAAYGEKVMAMFRGCSRDELAPHIYSAAQLAYQKMIQTRRDQSLLFLGQSGSGKTSNLTSALHFLAHTARSHNNVVTSEKLLACQAVLKSFGSCCTDVCANASKFTQIISLEFDYAGQITGASIQGILLEKSRMVRHSPSEGTFEVFAQLVYGCDEEERARYGLPSSFPEDSPYFSHQVMAGSESTCRQHAYNWNKLKNALKIVGVSSEEQHAIFSVVSAVYHLLQAGASKTGTKYEFVKPAHAERAAQMLGVKVQTLSRAIFYGSLSGPMRSRAGAFDNSGFTSKELLEGMVVGLFADLFNAVLSLINRSLSANYRSTIAMHIVDSPGLVTNKRVPAGDESGGLAGLEDLFCNYIHERLHQLFYEATVSKPMDMYRQERIDIDFGDSMPVQPSLIIGMIDQHPTKKPSLENEEEEIDVKGLLWLLDEESIFTDTTETTFLDRLVRIYGDKKDGVMTRSKNKLTIRHCQGYTPVTYNVDNWLKHCKENPVARVSLPLVQDSSNDAIATLFAKLRSFVSGTTTAGGVTNENTLNLRRQTQVRRGFSSIAAVKKNSLCLQVKFQLDFTLELVKHTQMHFVMCVSPDASSGLQHTSATPIDVPYLRTQIQAMQIVFAARIFRLGYPDYINFTTFIRSYAFLAPPGFQLDPLDERGSCGRLLEGLEVAPSNFAIGVTKVFLRCGVLADLDARRNEKLGSLIVNFQAYCRGYQARQDLKRIQLQNRAISCIQKNIRKYMQVREWAWWKLYTRVSPLAKVAVSEEGMKDKERLLEEAQKKLEAREAERSQLLSKVDKLESQVLELTTELTEEQAGLNHTTELYETELQSKRSMEEQIKSLKQQVITLEKKCSRAESELISVRMSSNYPAAAAAGEDSDDDVDDEVFKRRYEQVKRHADSEQRRLQCELEEQSAELAKLRKNLERKLADARDDLDDSEHAVAQLKRKSAKFQQELQDMQLHLQQQISRNAELERKQRRFDSELQQAHALVSTERQAKDKLVSDKENLLGENYKVTREKEALAEKLELAEGKAKRLESELEDLSLSADHSSEVTALKREKHQLQSRVRELEEELDDSAGEVLKLEQTKLRLEMDAERIRADLNKELEQREDEIESLKQNYSKKMRNLESQLDDEAHERQMINREKMDLERKLKELQNMKPVGDADRERRLKKDLIHTRGLLSDVQTMLESVRSQASTTKRESRQLRSQLEEMRDTAEAANSAKATLTRELQEAHAELSEIRKLRAEEEEKVSRLTKEKSDLELQLEEVEEDLSSMDRKLKNVLNEAAIDRNCIASLTSELADSRRKTIDLEEEVAGLKSKLSSLQDSSVDRALLTKSEAKVTELERLLSVEKTINNKNENVSSRLKDHVDKYCSELERLRSADKLREDASKRVTSQNRDLKDELASVTSRLEQTNSKKRELEVLVEELEETNGGLKQELNVANQRIGVLQRSIQDALHADDDDYDSSDDADGGRPRSEDSLSDLDMNQLNTTTDSTGAEVTLSSAEEDQ